MSRFFFGLAILILANAANALQLFPTDLDTVRIITTTNSDGDVFQESLRFTSIVRRGGHDWYVTDSGRAVRSTEFSYFEYDDIGVDDASEIVEFTIDGSTPLDPISIPLGDFDSYRFEENSVDEEIDIWFTQGIGETKSVEREYVGGVLDFVETQELSEIIHDPTPTAPVTWELHDVTFNDGTLLSGTFDFNALTNEYSNVNVTSQAGNAIFCDGDCSSIDLVNPFGGHSYSSGLKLSRDIIADYNNLFAFTTDELPNLFLAFEGALTNFGGIVQIDRVTEWANFDVPLTDPDPRRFDLGVSSFRNTTVLSGYVQAEVPEPSTFIILGFGFLGLCLSRTRALTGI